MLKLDQLKSDLIQLAVWAQKVEAVHNPDEEAYVVTIESYDGKAWQHRYAEIPEAQAVMRDMSLERYVSGMAPVNPETGLPE